MNNKPCFNPARIVPLLVLTVLGLMVMACYQGVPTHKVSDADLTEVQDFMNWSSGTATAVREATVTAATPTPKPTMAGSVNAAFYTSCEITGTSISAIYNSQDEVVTYVIWILAKVGNSENKMKYSITNGKVTLEWVKPGVIEGLKGTPIDLDLTGHYANHDGNITVFGKSFDDVVASFRPCDYFEIKPASV